MSGEEAGMGEGVFGEGFSGSVDATCLQWFCFSFFLSHLSYFLFLSISLSLSLSLSPQQRKKRKKKKKKKKKKKNKKRVYTHA